MITQWGGFKLEFNSSMSNDEFLDFLFSKIAPLSDDLDLHEDDSCCDHLAFEDAFQLNLF